AQGVPCTSGSSRRTPSARRDRQSSLSTTGSAGSDDQQQMQVQVASTPPWRSGCSPWPSRCPLGVSAQRVEREHEAVEVPLGGRGVEVEDVAPEPVVVPDVEDSVADDLEMSRDR